MLKRKRRALQNNAKATQNNSPVQAGKLRGGITGKGFLPGKSGNPSGRKPKRPLSFKYEQTLEMSIPESLRKRLNFPPGATYADTIAIAMAIAAIEGDTNAAREIREAVEGKADQRIKLTGSDGDAVKVKMDGSALVKALKEVYYGLSDVKPPTRNLPEAKVEDDGRPEGSGAGPDVDSGTGKLE